MEALVSFIFYLMFLDRKTTKKLLKINQKRNIFTFKNLVNDLLVRFTEMFNYLVLTLSGLSVPLRPTALQASRLQLTLH